MPSVFLSYAREDMYFVKLLTAILEYHHVVVWWDNSAIEPGSDFSAKIDQGLTEAKCLLTVISQNALTSQWMVKEIITFQERNPGEKVIPLLWDKTSPTEVTDSLRPYQSIDFQPCLHAGFDQLLNCFNKQFLPKKRREVEARRKSPPVVRMRYGFWQFCEMKLGITASHEIETSRLMIMWLTEVLGQKIDSYRYYKKGTNIECDYLTTLDTASDQVLKAVRNRPTIKTQYLVELIAEEIDRNYRVEMKDRRLEAEMKKCAVG
jgi:TIR domain